MFLIKKLINICVACLALPVLFLVAIFSKRMSKPRLFWGPDPIINNHYFCQALKEKGYDSKTVMRDFFSINKIEDFDVYFGDFLPKKGAGVVKVFLPYLVFIYALRNFDIFHIPFSGGILGNTPLKYCEAYLLKLADCKIVCLPYGSDGFVYGEIDDLSTRHALQLSYPAAGKISNQIKKQILYWSRHADCIVLAFMTDTFPRWDVLCGSYLSIDCSKWKASIRKNNADGKTGVVRVFHTPNHRGCKGTEFIIRAVEELQAEGLTVELVLIEGMKNDDIKSHLETEADILCDQLIIPGYGLSAVEGMACGIPVISNLSSERYLSVFRRFSFLNHCPIASATPENCVDQLRRLVQDPSLRRKLGKLGRNYVEKFHSFQTSQYLFTSIYEKIWFNQPIDLMNLFHPLNSEFVLSYENNDGAKDQEVVHSIGNSL